MCSIYSSYCYFKVVRKMHQQTNKRDKVKSLSRVRLFATRWTVAYQAPPSMGFSGKNTGVRCHFLLQGIFPTQGSNLGLLHCRQILYWLSHDPVVESLTQHADTCTHTHMRARAHTHTHTHTHSHMRAHTPPHLYSEGTVVRKFTGSESRAV